MSCDRCQELANYITDGDVTISIGFYSLKTACGEIMRACEGCRRKYFNLQLTTSSSHSPVHIDLECEDCMAILKKVVGDRL